MNIKDIIGESVYNTLSEDKKKELKDKDFEDISQGTYIPKSRFDEVNNSKKELEKQVKERDKQLEEAKKNSGDNEALKKQLEDAQEVNKAAQKKYEEDLKELQISNAIKLAISDKAQDAELVAGLFDKSKLILGEDGKVTGLEEQLKTIKEGKPFLFKSEDTNNTNTQFKGMEPSNSNNKLPDSSNIQGQTPSIKSALTALFANKE